MSKKIILNFVVKRGHRGRLMAVGDTSQNIKRCNTPADPCGRAVYSHSLVGIAGSNPAESVDVCCECCVLFCRGLRDRLINRPEESYRM